MVRIPTDYSLDDGIVDEIAIERALKGEKIPLRPAERREAVRILHNHGHGYAAIMQRLGMGAYTVRRILAELDDTAAA